MNTVFSLMFEPLRIRAGRVGAQRLLALVFAVAAAFAAPGARAQEASPGNKEFQDTGLHAGSRVSASQTFGNSSLAPVGAGLNTTNAQGVAGDPMTGQTQAVARTPEPDGAPTSGPEPHIWALIGAGVLAALTIRRRLERR